MTSPALFVSSPACRAGFQRDLRSRTAHEDHAALLTSVVLAGWGTVTAPYAVGSGDVVSRHSPVTEAASLFPSPPGWRLEHGASTSTDQVILDGPPRSPLPTSACSRLPPVTGRAKPCRALARDRPLGAYGYSPRRERPFRADVYVALDARVVSN